MFIDPQKAISFLYGVWSELKEDETETRFGFIPPAIEDQIKEVQRFIGKRNLDNFTTYECYSPVRGGDANKHGEFRNCVSRAVESDAVIVIPHRDILTAEEYAMANATRPGLG